MRLDVAEAKCNAHRSVGRDILSELEQLLDVEFLSGGKAGVAIDRSTFAQVLVAADHCLVDPKRSDVTCPG